MRKSNFALRLQPSLMAEARKVAEAEGVAVNQLINVAVAEKLSALRTEEYLAERAKRGSVSKGVARVEAARHRESSRRRRRRPCPSRQALQSAP